MAHSLGRPTLDPGSGHDLAVSPVLGCALSVQSLLGILSLSSLSVPLHPPQNK